MCIPIYQDERENYPSLFRDVHHVSHSDQARDAVLVAAVLPEPPELLCQ